MIPPMLVPVIGTLLLILVAWLIWQILKTTAIIILIAILLLMILHSAGFDSVIPEIIEPFI
ncbi:MAG: hypothetical protein ACLFSM_08850 [Thermoplasmata archaeon]